MPGMNENATAKPCTSDRNQRKYCRHYNERTGLCANPPATRSAESSPPPPSAKEQTEA